MKRFRYLKRYNGLILLLALCGCSFIFSDPAPVKKNLSEISPSIQKEEIKQTKVTKPAENTHKKAELFVQKGDTLLFEGNKYQAYRQYSNALAIDPENIPAIMGQAKCFLLDKKFDLAYSLLHHVDEKAKRTPYSPEFSYLLIQASISQVIFDNTGLQKIENAYYHALPAYRNKPELYYYMGLACQKFFQYNRAKTFFSKVISLKSKYYDAAFDQIDKILELEQCKSCEFREKLPLIPQISRAQMAYILHHELNIHGLLSRFSNYRSKPHPQVARDINSHPLKHEIQAVLPLNLSGLSLFSGHQFQPEMPLTRGDLSRIIFEIVNQIVPQLESQYNSSTKRWAIADIRSSQPFYRSVIFCTENLILLPLETGEFNPYGPVSGADAIMSIRTLKHYIDQLAIGR